MESQSNRGADPLARISIVDRLDALVRHPKRLLATIVALLVATGAAVGSSAVLTSSSTNPGNTFSAPNFNVTNNGTSALLSVSGMHPGDNTAPAPITIQNNGELPADMTLDVGVTGDTAPKNGHIASVLTATVMDVTTLATPVTVYSGPASVMPSQGLGTFAAGESRNYTIQLGFPSTSGNTFQLSTATLRYTWTAHQQ
ncbi:MAG: hypothetical protein ACJ77M_16890 [Thermoleophilaceae bacterium]